MELLEHFPRQPDAKACSTMTETAVFMCVNVEGGDRSIHQVQTEQVQLSKTIEQKISVKKSIELKVN